MSTTPDPGSDRELLSRHPFAAVCRRRVTLEAVDIAGNSANSKAEVVARLRAHELEIAAFGVKRLGLFGSFVRDEAGPDSDVDLLVEFEAGSKSFDSFMQLSHLLEEVLHRPVELVTVEALSPHIGPAILESAEKVIHHYFGVDYDIVWDVVVNKAPRLREQVADILRRETSDGLAGHAEGRTDA